MSPGDHGQPDEPLHGSHDDDGFDAAEAAVVEVNHAFYDAFEAGDLDAMSDLWLHDDRVVCVHPGWTALRGWASVASSWAAMFAGPQQVQFIVTDEHVVIVDEIAWISCDENLLTVGASATVSALNVFERGLDGHWRMVVHHGAPVMVSSDDEDD
jgi:ketosteroid isomerase-like protein